MRTRQNDEALRLSILMALGRPNRDELLRDLGVETVRCGEQDWFDLRELIVRRGELGGPVSFARVSVDYAHFEDVDLGGAVFEDALVRGATFSRVQAEGSNWSGALLEDTEFVSSDLTGGSFRLADGGRGVRFVNSSLDDADLFRFEGRLQAHSGSARRANFGEAFTGKRASGEGIPSNFVETDLTAASFRRANLERSSLVGSVIDDVDFSDTVLRRARLEAVRFDRKIRFVRSEWAGVFLGDMDLSNVDVAYVVWSLSGPYLGEEVRGDTAEEGVGARKRYLSQAELIYRALERRYRDLGYSDEALKFRYRALEARRKWLWLDGFSQNGSELTTLWLSRELYRYGTSPPRWLLNVGLVIAAFAISYVRLCKVPTATAVYYSVFFFFRFAAEAVDYRPVLQLLFGGHEEPKVTGWRPRIVAATEAIGGLVLMYLGVKCVLLTVGVL